MSKYSEIKKKASGGKYARGGKCYASGGRVGESAPKGGKTVVNVIVPPSAGAAPAAGAAGPVAPMPSGAPPQPVPPAAAAMAMQKMSGKPPGAFAAGGRVGKQLTNASGGAGGGKGRLRKVVIEK